jgi:DNA repair exonuclease SbcCD ATPase subunit
MYAVRRRPGRFGTDRLQEAEAAVARRLHELDEHAAELARAARELVRREEAARLLVEEVERRLVNESSELDEREEALDELAGKLSRRDAGLSIRESELEERRRQLGAVELQRAALERREEAVEARERALRGDGRPRATATGHLLFVPGERYEILEEDGAPPVPGSELDLDGTLYVVVRLGASPLPDDARPCAFLSP